MNKWQPIETAPNDNKSYLLFCPDMGDFGLNPCIVVGVKYAIEKADKWHELVTDCYINPSHWMPLPDAPK